MYENAFNNIYKTLRKDDDISTELDYVEQTSWVIFLKYLQDMEQERESEALLEGHEYLPLFEAEFRWSAWAYPVKDEQFDDNRALVGDDLVEFVNQKLFPYLSDLVDKASGKNQSKQRTIGVIFRGIRNKFSSGYLLRDVIDEVQGLSFNTQASRHELSELYETRIKNMGNSGRNGGEYYTPRPLIRSMLKVVDPEIGETVYDGAVGSAGFLCEAYEYMRAKDALGVHYEELQERTFYGQEKKPLAYIIGMINMMLHGIDAPNIIRKNSLSEKLTDIQDEDRHDIILANPPFGGDSEETSIQSNFPIRSGEAAYLFLQHFIKKLKPGGRAAIVIKNTFLSNDDAKALRAELLQSCNLHTILDCPAKVFLGAGVKTVVLFFEKGAPTKQTWYYQLDPGRSLGKNKPLNDDDLAEFVSLQKTSETGEKSWLVNRADVDVETYDLSVKNPNSPEEAPLRSPEEIIEDMLARDAETAAILQKIRGLL